MLAHYDTDKPLVILCKTSPCGIGAVLAQEGSRGREVPIAFASRVLGLAEQNCVQLDREGLAVVFAAQHFYKFIVGRKAPFYTDHQLLLGILGSTMPVLSHCSARWCIRLSAYDYDLKYRPGQTHQNADALSRLPLKGD